MATIFISYSRRDQAFVRRIYDALREAGRDAWVDWEGIPPTAEWLQEVYGAIEEADAFLFVMSPASIASEVCGLEVAHATEMKKRIVPLVCDDVTAAEVGARKVTAPLAQLNWIFARPTDDFAAAVTKLTFALDLDLDYWHLSAQILVQARRWQSRAMNISLVLRGVALSEAERWLAEGRTKQPSPTTLQAEYIIASRRAATRRKRVLVSGLSGAMIVVLTLSILSVALFRSAGSEQDAALARRAAIASGTALQNAELNRALLLGVAASRLDDDVDSREALQQALVDSPHISGFTFAATGDGVTNLAVSEKQQAMYGIARVSDLTSYSSEVDSLVRWDLRKVQATAVPFGAGSAQHLHEMDDLVLSHDESMLATFGQDGILIWDASSGRILQHLGGPPPSAIAGTQGSVISFGPGNHAVLEVTFDTLSDGDATVVLQEWSLTTGELVIPPTPLRVGSLQSTYQRLIAFSPDGSQIAVADCPGAGCTQSRLSLWDAGTGQLTRTVEVGPSEITAIQYSHDSSKVALGLCIHPPLGDAQTCNDGVIQIISPQSGATLASAPIPSAFGRVLTLAFRPDDTYLVSSHYNGDCSVSNCLIGQMQLWTVPGLQMIGEPFATYGERLSTVVFLPDGLHVTAIDGGNELSLWYIGGFDPISTLLYTPDRRGGALDSQVVYANDDQMILVRQEDQTVIWDPMSGLRLGVIHQQAPNYETYAQISPDGKLIAEIYNGIIIWNVATRSILKTLAPNAKGIGESAFSDSVVFSPDGMQLAALQDGPGANDEGITIWNLATGRAEASLKVPVTGGGWIRAMAFSADGRSIIANTANGVGAWSISSGKEASSSATDAGIRSVTDFAVSPDGRTIALVERDGQLQLWDMVNHSSIQLAPPASHYYSVPTFSPDGRFLLALNTADAAIWDVLGHQVYTDLPHTNSIHAAAFTSDSHFLAWDGGDGVTLVRSLHVDDWQRTACAIANRNLTEDEWNAVLPDVPYQRVCPNAP